MGVDRLHEVLLLCCISLFIFIHGITRSEASQSPTDSLFGVSPEDENYYEGLLSSSSIKCKDGSKKFNKSQFNDDFCDCPDGSDEPGTSACPNGKFYCRNAGHTPIFLYSSRVNDGICDCCDGSDEYDGKTQCPNMCWEAGKVAREKLRKKIATYKEGIAIRKKEIEQAKTATAKDEGELSKLKDEEKTLNPLVEKLKEHKERIEKAEEEERQRKEKEKESKESQEAKEKEGKVEDIEHVQNDVPDTAGETDQIQQDLKEDSHESVHEPELVDHSTNEELPHDEVGEVYKDSHQNDEQAGKDSTTDGKDDLDTDIQDENAAEGGDSLSREELGRLVASRWTGEKSEQGKEEFDASSNKDNQKPDETQHETIDEEDNGYISEDDEHRYDDVDEDDSYDQTDDLAREDQYDSSSSQNIESDDELDFADPTSTSSLSWLEKIQKTVKNVLQAVNLFQTPVNVSDAAHIRKEYDEASAKLSKIQSRISKLTQKLGHDFGPEQEFYSFYGQCFESKENKYVYKVCPFKQATQEEGYSTTRLGSWAKFEDSYRSMQFLNGDKCWNGPDRSLKVKLRCGLKNELTDVDEPSRCEYLALLATPAVCVESKLKELEEKLELMNQNQPKGEGHDEL